MPARRIAKPPRTVTVASLADTGDAATDRVMIQAEQNLQDLQEQQRAGAATATSQGATITSQGTALTALTARVTTLEGKTGGRVLGVQYLTGSGTYAPTSGTRAVEIEGVACGGGGGGGQGVNGCGAGGTSGAYFRKRVAPGVAVTGGAYSAPTTGGTAGSAVGGAGGTGSDATLVVQGVTYTLKGGPGGGGMPAPAGTTFAGPGGVVGGSSAGDVPASQDNGSPGLFFAGSFGVSGEGGESPLGAGGSPSSTAAPGAGGGGQGFGGGGGGGNNGTGGVGAGAVWIIHEYS